MTQWKLVPVEPTPEMMKAGVNVKPYTASRIYAAMLDAAPEPDVEPVAWNWMQQGNPCSPAYYDKQPDDDIAKEAAAHGKTVRLLYTAPQPAKPAEQEPFTVLVRKHSWLPNQWEAAPCGFPDYGKQWADERINVYTAPQPANPDTIAELEQEARLMRARMERIEAERQELLEALQGMLEVFGDEFGMGDSEIVDLARAAIAKVEGKV